jgi:cytochrome P450
MSNPEAITVQPAGPPPDRIGGRFGTAVSRRSSLAVLGTIVRNPLAAIPRECFEYGITTARVFGRTRLYVSDPDLIQEALVRNGDALPKGPEVRRILGPALGQGLLTADGQTWRWQRRSIAPTFQHERLQDLLPPMIAAAEATRDRWLGSQPGTSVDVGHEMMMTTFKIIVDTMLSGPGGIDAERVERCVTDYLGSTSWMFALSLLKAPDSWPYPGKRRAMEAAATLRRIIEAMVAERRRAGGAKDDLVALLLAAVDPDSGRTMTDEEISDNLITFITAGHETTAVALSWTLMLLAANPEVEVRVVDEIAAVTGDGPVHAAQIGQLAYTKQVFNEAMRLYPPAPLISREVLTPFTLGGVALEVGTTLVVPIYALHRHVHLYPDPERFDPDRFAPAQAKARHRYAFMPFGAGARICIGSAFATMEGVAVLAVLLKAVRARRLSPDDMPGVTMRVTLRPSRPLRMSISPRAAA